MQEQTVRYPKRASATQEELAARRTVPSASMHRAGHNAGLHPEDTPYLSGTVSRTAAEEIEESDSYYPKRMPSSARRYTTTDGHEIIQQGNKRIVIHKEPPPKPKRRFHWLSFVGLALFTMIVGWIAFTLLTSWWQAKQIDWKYGFPRTFQVDQFVGHADSSNHPNHFIAVNVAGTIEVVELNTTRRMTISTSSPRLRIVPRLSSSPFLMSIMTER